jgi:hypothetical protein
MDNLEERAIVIYDTSVKSKILFLEKGETNPSNKIKSLLTRISYLHYFF